MSLVTSVRARNNTDSTMSTMSDMIAHANDIVAMNVQRLADSSDARLPTMSGSQPLVDGSGVLQIDGFDDASYRGMVCVCDTKHATGVVHDMRDMMALDIFPVHASPSAATMRRSCQPSVLHLHTCFVFFRVESERYDVMCY